MTRGELKTVVAVAEREGACLCLFFAEMAPASLNPSARLQDIVKPHPLCPPHKELAAAPSPMKK